MGVIAPVTDHRAMFTFSSNNADQNNCTNRWCQQYEKRIARDDHVLSQTYEQLRDKANIVALTTGSKGCFIVACAHPIL